MKEKFAIYLKSSNLQLPHQDSKQSVFVYCCMLRSLEWVIPHPASIDLHLSNQANVCVGTLTCRFSQHASQNLI